MPVREREREMGTWETKSRGRERDRGIREREIGGLGCPSWECTLGGPDHATSSIREIDPCGVLLLCRLRFILFAVCNKKCRRQSSLPSVFLLADGKVSYLPHVINYADGKYLCRLSFFFLDGKVSSLSSIFFSLTAKYISPLVFLCRLQITANPFFAVCPKKS